jgi:hypothetical protein
MLRRDKSKAGHEPSGSLHVIPIVVTESGDEILLVFPRADHSSRNTRQPARKKKPVGRDQGLADDLNTAEEKSG